MKIFVRNDNRLCNITKRQKAFLCIVTGYKEVTKVLQKGYKSYKIVISISLWALSGIYRAGAGVCPQWRSVPVCTSKGAAFEELGAAFGDVGSCVSKGAMSKRSIAAVESYNFRLLKSKRKEKTIDFFIKE